MRTEEHTSPTIGELAKQQGISKNTVRRWIQENDPRADILREHAESIFDALESTKPR